MEPTRGPEAPPLARQGGPPTGGGEGGTPGRGGSTHAGDSARARPADASSSSTRRVSEPRVSPDPVARAARSLRSSVTWRSNPKGVAVDLLRVGIGIVWALNLIFILAPSNQFFSGFRQTASGFANSSLGGPGLANLAASYPAVFAWGVALLTGYLAVAFLSGTTTRLACIVGGIASSLFIVTQFYSTFALDGTGTDVGPHPLYILIYLILFLGGAGQYFAFDHWVWASGHARFPRLSRWIASPRGVLGTERPAGRDGATFLAGAGPGGPGADPVYSVLYPSAHTKLSFLALGLALGLAVAGVGAYSVVSAQAPGPLIGAPSLSTNLTLTIAINLQNGWPQYTPANFSVPSGRVSLTIVDDDAPMYFPGCLCAVTGTVGNLEHVNGTPLHTLNDSNIAHTFDVPALGLNVLSPGMSVVTFTTYFNETGTFSWTCEAPCGTLTPEGPPMGVPGYMTGTITVL